MANSSNRFYKEFISSDETLETLAQKKGIKCSSACKYISNNYQPEDASVICKKLNLDRFTIANTYRIMIETQEYRKAHPEVKSESLTYYIHKALGNKCTNCCLATSIIRKLHNDLCL